jgi:hypothetical protein
MQRKMPRRTRFTPADGRSLGLNANITRRDFLGSTLIGSGALLLGAAAPSRAQGLTSQWNGYAGIGDYSRSNGNIASVVNAAHGVRDGIYEARIDGTPVVDELYDLIIVGGGFAGLIAAYEFRDDVATPAPRGWTKRSSALVCVEQLVEFRPALPGVPEQNGAQADCLSTPNVRRVIVDEDGLGCREVIPAQQVLEDLRLGFHHFDLAGDHDSPKPVPKSMLLAKVCERSGRHV